LIRVVDIHEAKIHLSRLVNRAAKGEPFIIAEAGKRLVKVIPIEQLASAQVRRIGFMAGQFSVPDDFDHMCSDAIGRLFDAKV
jgi:prevent-host-death family protein